jgi:PKD repeat protein
MKCIRLVLLIGVALVISAVLVPPGVQISWQHGWQVRFEPPDVHAAGSSVTNSLAGDLVVFSQDYTGMSAVPGNMCLASEYAGGFMENVTLGYNGTSHCVSFDGTQGAFGKLFVGGLSPSLSTTLTLDMGLGRTEDHANLNVFAGGAWLAIRLRDGAPSDDLVITSCYYNPTLSYSTSITEDVGFNNGGRFEITIVSNSVSMTNMIYLNDVKILTTPFTGYREHEVITFYDAFVNPFIYFTFDSIYSGQSAYLQLYAIEQTVPEYSYVTPITDPRLTSFGVDGPHAWNTVDAGLSLVDGGTVWADPTFIDDYSPSDLAALKALIADGWELGIHFSYRLSDLPLADAYGVMDNETALVTGMFGKAPTTWCSLQGADNNTHAEYAYTNLGMVSRNGVNGSGGGLSNIGNLGDNCWTFWSAVSAAGIVMPSFSHELDITPAIEYSISPANFSAFLSNYADNGVRIGGFREYWEKAQNSYHTVVSNVVSDPGVSLSFTMANTGGKSRLLVNAPWADVVRDGSGGGVPYETSGSGIVVEVEAGSYTVSAVPEADFSADRTAVVVGQAIQFTNLSHDGAIPLSYQWDFSSDGSWDSSDQDPSHAFSSAGTYTVVLKAIDSAANTDTESKVDFITVSAALRADFTLAGTAVVVGQAISFSDNSTGGVLPLSYQWDFNNDGVWDSTERNPSHAFGGAGTYAVVLKITDSAANTDTETRTDLVTVSRPSPDVQSVTPNRGTRGQTLSVVVTGTDLGAAAAVSFGSGVNVDSYRVETDTRITAGITIAGDAQTGQRTVTVQTPGGTDELPGGFTVMLPAPVVESVEPRSGVVGETFSIIILGSNFTGAETVHFGPGIAVNSFVVESASRITANVTIDSGVQPGAYDVIVTTPSGEGTLAGAFTAEKRTSGVWGYWWFWVVVALPALGLGLLVLALIKRRSPAS